MAATIIRRQYPTYFPGLVNIQVLVTEDIDDSTTISEMRWRFIRYPEGSGGRITARDNPHFYHGLSDKATSYGNKFQLNPLDITFAYHRGVETIYVLVDKPCRIFLDTEKPRIFGNLWKPHHSFILKGEYTPRRVVDSN